MTQIDTSVCSGNGKMDRKDALRLDIGCGLNKRDGFVGVDRSGSVDADYIADVDTENLPFDDNSVDEIYCAHLVEHLHNLIHFMNECHRVLKSGGTMTILAPYYTAIQASQDPTHVRFINERTFAYFTSEFNGDHSTFDYSIQGLFEIDSIDYGYINIWAKPWFPNRVRNWARKHLYNVAADITVQLHKV